MCIYDGHGDLPVCVLPYGFMQDPLRPQESRVENVSLC